MSQDSMLSRQEDDWEVLQSFLPLGWQEKARELGALRRCRKFADAEVLLRTLLIHLADGCSLRETAVRAKQGRLVSVSDVALLKRLKGSGEWLRWMASGLMESWVSKPPAAFLQQNLCIRMIDSSSIQEPGSTGTDWRLHYSIRFPDLQCDEVYVTRPRVGESFKLFSVHPGDLFMGDRGFARRADLSHVVGAGGDVLVRMHLTALPLVNKDGNPFLLLQHLRGLHGTRLGDWDTSLTYEGKSFPGRVCALKKNKRAAEKARRKARRDAARKGHQVKPETLEAAGYIVVFTTLHRNVSPTTLLEMYRGRWQIELAFKRLKSIMGLGHLKKTDVDAAKAWIHGKLFVAFLIEALISEGERFSPWGYPISQDIETVTLPLAGNKPDAAFG